MKQKTNILQVISLSLMLSALLTLSALAQPATAPKPAAPMSAAEQTIADWMRAKDFTREYLDAMPEDGMGFKAAPDIRSFAEQMLHLTNANFAFASAASGMANPYQGKNLEKLDEYKTKAALTKVVLESYDFVIAAFKSVEAPRHNEQIKLFGREMTRALAFHKAFEHQTHHRGQATIYLRLKGIKPPNEKLF
jgi:uncharacterized damage-inducible protein DinB